MPQHYMHPKLTMASLLVPAVPQETLPSFIHGLKLAYLTSLEQQARDSSPGIGRWISKALTPQDLGENDWDETSGATDSWVDTDIVDQEIADNTYVMIYGVRMLRPVGVLEAESPVIGFRFDIGGSRVAEWDIYSLLYGFDQVATGGGAGGEANIVRPIAGYALSPITISPNKLLTIQERVVLATTAYAVQFLGYVVEPEGLTLRP